MGKGRSPCCDKTQVKRGPWSPCEDLRLIAFIQKNGHDNWRALPKQAGLLRCGKSCRLRWINYLRPDVKRGNFTREEEDSILRLHEDFGNKWSKIAAHFPGRTDNEIKNVWNTHLKKRLASRNISKSCGDDHSKELSSVTFSSPSSSSNNSFLSSGKPSVREELLVEHQSADQEISMATTNEPHETCSLTIPEKLNEDLPVELANQFKLDPKDLKELTCSFSASSNESDGSNSSQVLGVSRPEEPMDFLFDFARLCDDIPFESDFEFWNMLNGLVPSVPPISQSIDQVLQVHETHEAATHQRSDLGQVESDKWLSYLESQLGLEAQATTKSCDCQNNLQEILTKDVTADQAQLVPETFQSYCDKILPNPAAEDHNMAFFAKQFCHLD